VLPPQLKRLKEALQAKGVVKRTVAQDSLLEELEGIDDAIDKATGQPAEQFRKAAAAKSGYMGPEPGKCPTCGGAW